MSLPSPFKGFIFIISASKPPQGQSNENQTYSVTPQFVMWKSSDAIHLPAFVYIVPCLEISRSTSSLLLQGSPHKLHFQNGLSWPPGRIRYFYSLCSLRDVLWIFYHLAIISLSIQLSYWTPDGHASCFSPFAIKSLAHNRHVMSECWITEWMYKWGLHVTHSISGITYSLFMNKIIKSALQLLRSI